MTESATDCATTAATTKIEYQAVCADGGDVSGNVYAVLADAVKHAEAMDSNPNCSPHRVRRRTVTYGEWSDA